MNIMKVFISVDMEGITGVSVSAHVNSAESDYQRFRKLMTRDVNAAIEGAIEAGATGFVVNDSHGPMTNILIEELHNDARLISGNKKHLGQMEGIGKDFDLVFLVGYHDREGSYDAVLNHSFYGRMVLEIRCNGEPMGEAAVNAGAAGHFGVPIGLVTGDNLVCADAAKRFTGVETAVVKDAISRFSACSLTPAQSQTLIRQRAKAAVEKAASLVPYRIKTPVTFEVDFKSTAEAYACDVFPELKRTGPRTIAFSAVDYLTAYKILWGVFNLGASATR